MLREFEDKENILAEMDEQVIRSYDNKNYENDNYDFHNSKLELMDKEADEQVLNVKDDYNKLTCLQIQDRHDRIFRKDLFKYSG